MEIFTDDRRFLQPAGSFPASADFAGHLQSPDDDHFIADHRLNMPPQKLRPIRSSGRSPAEYTPEFADVVEFLGHQACPVNCVSGECFEAGIKAGSAGAAGVGGIGSGQTGNDAAAEDRGAGVETRASEDLTGSLSSSDYHDNSSVDIKESPSRKRKRKSRRMIELLMENLIFKVMEKQDQMHKQLMGMIERKERERIMREEAWKQQQMERLKKEEEARAQEASRSLAIISFIQRMLGLEIEIPLQSSGSCMEENGGRDGHDDQLQQDNNTTSNLEDEKHPGAKEHQGVHDQDDVNQVRNFNGDVNRNCLQGGINEICDPQDKRWVLVPEQANVCPSNVLQNHEQEDVNHVKCLGGDNHLQAVISQKNDSTDKRWMGAQGQTNISQGFSQENRNPKGICHGVKFPSDGNVNHVKGNDALKEGNHDRKFTNSQCDQNARRWPDSEVQALITLRSELEHKFHSTGSKCPLWVEISNGMSKLGYARSAKKCKEKWENMNKYFKKATESGKKQFENNKRCNYFHDLDMLYKNGLVDAENPVNGLGNHQKTG